MTLPQRKTFALLDIVAGLVISFRESDDLTCAQSDALDKLFAEVERLKAPMRPLTATDSDEINTIQDNILAAMEGMAMDPCVYIHAVQMMVCDHADGLRRRAPHVHLQLEHVAELLDNLSDVCAIKPKRITKKYKTQQAAMQYGAIMQRAARG